MLSRHATSHGLTLRACITAVRQTGIRNGMLPQLYQAGTRTQRT